MTERHSLFDTITSFFVPVHPDGHKFVALSAIVTLVFFWLWAPLGWLGALITFYIVYFFRDPIRTAPLREGLVVAPADGVITAVDLIQPPGELDLGPQHRTRVSIFLSVFDVHINRAPVAGKIIKIVYTPGLFLNADLDKSSVDNERNGLVIETATGDKFGVVQIAGLIARRIICFSKEGERIGIGERFGLIRFGSRVDVYLPLDKTAICVVGQTAIGGETVLADLKSDESPRESRQI